MTSVIADDDDRQDIAGGGQPEPEEEQPLTLVFPPSPQFPKELEPKATVTFQHWYTKVKYLERLLAPEANAPDRLVTQACLKLLRQMEHMEDIVRYLSPELRTLWTDGGNTAEAWLRSHGIQPQRTQQRPTGRRR